ncbi:CPBP family intramembrane glutamic endopeptidase [Jeotgalibacillus sp. R-1-5s-1]|uniref:CPBP family intramembrane glutamic endopeptidase n=1 Tax=Jeotgalibacillus sp. R-1-5s-1 TaxID=2555897 RepID=UPI001FC85899|nr:type II CAAX endopeptidase family protein [Jeotgalibacillus sp. R-1-5s-1]
MNRTFLIILITYVAMQLSSFVVVPVALLVGRSVSSAEPTVLLNLVSGYWIFLSFMIGLIVILFVLNRNKGVLDLPGEKAGPAMIAIWSFIGIFLAFFSQMIAVGIEYLIGIEPGSDNTAQLIDLLSYVPLAAVAIAIFGPILEEIVFRGVIFGWFYRKYNFFISGLISALIFAVIHFDFTHILIYAAMGYAFAFLYAFTKKIIVPIIAHMAINTFVVMTQFFFAEEIQRIVELNEAFALVWRAVLGGIL